MLMFVECHELIFPFNRSEVFPGRLRGNGTVFHLMFMLCVVQTQTLLAMEGERKIFETLFCLLW